MQPCAAPANRSPFRRIIASVAREQDEIFRKRMAFSRGAYDSLQGMKAANNGLILDLQKYSAAFLEFMGKIEDNSDDPFVRLLTCRRGGLKDWLDISQTYGFIMIPDGHGLKAGSLISEFVTGRMRSYILALHENQGMGYSSCKDVSDSHAVLLDAAQYLESVIFTINCYHYFSPEPVSSMLLSKDEMGKGKESARIYKDRLNIVSQSPTAVDEQSINRLMSILSASPELEDPALSSIRMAIARFQSLSIVGYSSEDPIAYARKVLDQHIKGAMVFHACPYVVGSGELNSEDSLLMATLGGLAYGFTYDKMAGLYSGILNNNEMMANIIYDLMNEMGYIWGQGQLAFNMFLFTRSEDQIRSSAGTLLDRIMRARFGRSLASEEKEFLSSFMGRMIILDEDMPTIVSAWKERFFDNSA